MKFTSKSDQEWVSGATDTVPDGIATAYRCIERRCEPLPMHAHKNRPYLAYAKERLYESGK